MTKTQIYDLQPEGSIDFVNLLPTAIKTKSDHVVLN
jgi:hypothetical protein